MLPKTGPKNIFFNKFEIMENIQFVILNFE